ncbi:MAG: hypothetical protein IKH97_05980 [Bacteroidales bacterium]|nr:hypothetical protein [Bacteroidales bacterium]
MDSPLPPSRRMFSVAAPIVADVLSCDRPSWWMFGISPVAEDVFCCVRFVI